jgi:hypothetical protein
LVQGREDLLSQHLLRDAHTDFRHCRTLFARIDEDMKVVSKIEKPPLLADRDGIKVCLLVSDLRASRIAEEKLGDAGAVVRSDFEVEVSFHDSSGRKFRW